MYLKSIVMQGFKSFANKIDLQFHEGITGIVGPNGSGKSNVADAVRWVLGEQSAKQLRGGNMQDVIFSGTESRKPLGYAQVAITFDNADGQLAHPSPEVTVTRKLFRSGESEYLLNGKACRLKDIHELFFDTGIGKEGYSIIGQGQIDKILSGKPDDRRELFDEAAGIVKFKRRKHTAVKKLEDEEQNLVRVTDILKELTRQVGPLSEQAKKAETFLRLRDKLKAAEISLFCKESVHIKEQEDEIRGKSTVANAHLEELKQSFEKTKQEYEEIEEQLQLLEEEQQALREEQNAYQQQLHQTQSQRSLLNEQILSGYKNHALLNQRKEAIEKELQVLWEGFAQQKETENALLKKSDEISGKSKETDRKLKQVKEEIASERLHTEQGRNRTISILNQRSAIKEKLQRYDTMLENIAERNKELSESLLYADKMERQHQDEEGILKDEVNALSAQLSECRKQQEDAAKELEVLLLGIADDRRILEEKQRAYHREASRLESLRNLAERYEGYGGSIKRVMAQKDRHPGIFGVVADLIQTEEAYELAIETALGGSLQNIVTDNENTAKEMIAYLKQGHFGRATFLPISSVKGGRGIENRALLAEKGVIGIAADLVRFEKRYAGIIGRLLGSTVVVDRIEHAIAIGRAYKQSVRMVTLEGDLISPGGAMTGGAYKNTSNLLGRKRELGELAGHVSVLKQDLDAFQEKAEQNRSRRDFLREAVQRLSGQSGELSVRYNTALLKLRNESEQKNTQADQIRRLKKEQSELEFQVVSIQEQKRTVGEELAKSEEAERALSTSMEFSSKKLTGLLEQEERLSAEAGALQLEFAEIRQQIAFFHEKQTQAEETDARLKKEQGDLIARMDTGLADSREKKVLISDLEAHEKELEEKKQRTDALFLVKLKRREEMQKEHKSFFEKRDALSEEIRMMDQECFRLQAKIEKYEETYDQLVAHLWEEYQITPDEALQEKKEEESMTALRTLSANIKKDIRSLGSVNVGAIEEYKEVKERYDFLNAQYEDLTKAAEDLKHIIKKLDEGMRRQFAAKFADIQKEFNRVFKELFGGGSGTLQLVEGEDVLEAGIVIIAQPPGKKLQNMMQLSGGEKALTAISLLFAIQNLKPSPFCLLDEIEAALDDSNVIRYAEYLHKLTKHTQFIIITHRRGSMAASDRLYGITMQEKGISTLVSVDLIESELEQ